MKDAIATIEIDASTLPETITRSEYALRVLEEGHRPGVLSGAELRGKAAKFGGWYRDKRGEVERALREQYDVTSEVTKTPAAENNARARVWVNADGAPVQIVVG